MLKFVEPNQAGIRLILSIMLSISQLRPVIAETRSHISLVDLIDTKLRRENIGAGAVVDPNGTVLTTYGLVASCPKIAVAWPSQPGRVATIAVADRKADLALLTVQGVQVAHYVRFSAPSPRLKPVVITQYQNNSAMTRFAAMEIADPLDLISSNAVFWAKGPKLFPSVVGGPVFEPSVGGVRGLVVGVYSRAGSAAKFHLDEPVLAAVGNPIIDVFLQQAALQGHALRGSWPTSLSETDVHAATAVVVCVL